MLGGIGTPELIIVVVIALLVALPGLRTAGASENGESMNGAAFIALPGPAVADFRYVRGVSAGNLAGLFGLGRYGIRWAQVAAVTVGLWLSNNAGMLVQLRLPNPETGAGLLSMLGSPVFFVAASFVAIRSFQSAAAVVVGTGVIYTLLYTSLRFAIAPAPGIFEPSDYWLRAAASSFAWTTLTMIALHFAVAGGHQWLRMIPALAIAELTANIVWGVIVLGEWSFERQLEAAMINPWPIVSSSLFLTAGFWVGSRISEGRTRSH